MNLRGKFKAMVMVSAAGLVAVAGFWIKSERSASLDGKMQKAKNLVEVPYSVMENQY
jgi:hypothetical protein